jgi:hypothetical protein
MRRRAAGACLIADEGSLAAAVTQELTWSGSRALALFKGDLSIYHDGAIAFGTLYTAPLAVRKIVNDLSDPIGSDL